MGWLTKTEADEKAEDHRRRGFDGPIDQNGDAHMNRTDSNGRARSIIGDGDGRHTPDDKDSPRAGNAARRSRRA